MEHTKDWRRPHLPHIARVVLVAAACLAVTAGCTRATEADNDSSAATDLDASQQECVDAVASDVETAEGETPLIVPDQPLDLSKIEGKNVWVVAALINQWGSDVLDGMDEAAEAAGVKLTRYDGQGQVNRYSAGIEQAVAQGADGIILLSIDPATVPEAVKAAKAAGIPVQNLYNGDPDDALADGIYGNLAAEPTAEGATQAKWILQNSGCQARVSFLYSPQVAVWQKLYDGAKATFDEYCPDECELNPVEIDLANFSVDIGSKLTSALQRDPDINYVWTAGDSAVTFVNPVLASANFQGTFVSHDGLETAVADIVNGGPLDMTMAWPPAAWIGWASVDDISRVLAGEEPSGVVVPTRIIDRDNVGDGTPADTFPAYEGFQDKFTAAWNG